MGNRDLNKSLRGTTLTTESMADADHELLITQFGDITGQDKERSKFFLESSGWDIELALGSFYEADGMDEEFEDAQPQAEAPKVANAEERPKADPAPTGGASSRQPASNINTFSSRFGSKANDDDDSSDSDSQEGQAFYAGGSETSGQQILGPKKDGSKFVKHMFKKAREHGAETVDPNSSMGAGGASSRPTFTGSGFKLGSSEDTPSEVVQGTSSKKEEEPREFALKMWQNGFSIDDGPLRDYNDKENREFLMEVMQGHIPRELVREARGGEVMVNMEDHKDKPYEKPKVKVKPFQGSGNVLGSIAPAVVSENSNATAQEASAALSESDAQKQVKVDTSKSMTTLQVRLASGGRLVVKLNETNTVSDLRKYICLVKPETPTNFCLLTTFPNKEHTDDAATLKDAGLLGAAILMRPK